MRPLDLSNYVSYIGLPYERMILSLAKHDSRVRLQMSTHIDQIQSELHVRH